ncbi:MAG: YceD family protein [Acidimicrobiales bacterium]
MGTSPPALVVNVADLLHRPGARRRVHLSSAVEALKVVSATVPDRSEVDVDALLEWVNDGILATGTVSAPWVAECRRCLTPVSDRARAPFQELFEPRAREGETYPLRGDRIDLAPLAKEALLLELPLAPLCREDCAGLCPTCGADRNVAPCACAPATRDPRWAALDDLPGNGG